MVLCRCSSFSSFDRLSKGYVGNLRRNRRENLQRPGNRGGPEPPLTVVNLVAIPRERAERLK